MADPYVIRIATPEELPVIYQLRYEVFVGPRRRPEHIIRDPHSSPVVNFVAELSGEIVGGGALHFDGAEIVRESDWCPHQLVEFLGTRPHPRAIASCWRCFVLPEHRRHNLQRRLIRARERHFASLGGAFLVAAIESSNAPSLHSFEAESFERYALWSTKEKSYTFVVKDIRPYEVLCSHPRPFSWL